VTALFIVEDEWMLGVDVRIERSRLITPLAVAALLNDAPLHVRLKSVASSWVAAAAAARRNEALSSFMSG
jgi:hypothetical protein